MKFTIKNKKLITVDKKESIKELVIPDGVEIIGKAAFKDCENLKKVTFNNNINIIDEEAFMGCTALEEVNFNLPKKEDQKTFYFYPHEIRKEAFSGCTNLKKVNFEFVEKFKRCGSLNLGDFAFANCINLEWLTIFDVFFSNWPNCGLSVFENCNKIFYSKNLPYWIELNKTKLFGLNLPTQFEISCVESFGNTYDSITVIDGKTNAIEIYDVDDIEKLSETISIDEFKKMGDRKWYATEMLGNVYYENVTEIISKLEDEDLKEELQEFYFDDTVAISSGTDGFEEMRILPYNAYVNWYDDEAILNGGDGEYSIDQVVNALEIIDRYFSKIEKAIRYICDKCNQDYEEFKKNYYESNYSFNWIMYSNKEELVIISKNPERNEIRYKNYRESI